ncbi:hypothetical protein V8D89_016265 [Ganoderma adspersum]
MTSHADTPFMELHARIERLSLRNKMAEGIRALKWHFMLLLCGLSDFSKLPDTYFKLFHGILLKNTDDNLITSQSINNFLFGALWRFSTSCFAHSNVASACSSLHLKYCSMHNDNRDRDSRRWTMHKMNPISMMTPNEPCLINCALDEPHINDCSFDEYHPHIIIFYGNVWGGIVDHIDHGKVTCDRYHCKHWKCTCFGRNSHREIKGKEKNIPWAVFNSMGHSIYKKVPKEYLPWVEACCRVVESSREASVVTVVQPKGITAVLKNGKFCPASKGLTEYWYNPATLPKYNVRKMLKCKIVNGAQLMSRLRKNDEEGKGDEDEELEGEAPEGDVAKEQDEEDASGSSPALGDHVSEQAEEEMDDPNDSEGSAVDLMPCKQSSHHMSRIYKHRHINSSPAVDNDVNVIQDYGDAGLTTNLEPQAALDVPPYEDELTTLMNFYTEQSWPEITAEDTEEREEQPYNNTMHEMAEQVEQMDAVSRQAGDGKQPTGKASTTNAPNVLSINPAEYEVSAMDRDNQAFAMRIHKRALTNLPFGKFSSTHIFPYNVYAYCVYLAANPNAPRPSMVKTYSNV